MQKLYIKIVVAIWVVMILSAVATVLVPWTNIGIPARDGFGPIAPTQMLTDLLEEGSQRTKGLGEAAFVDWVRGNPVLGNRLPIRVTRADGTILYEDGSSNPSRKGFHANWSIDPITISRSEGKYEVLVMRPPGDRMSNVSPVQRSIVRAAFQPQLIWWLLLVAIPISVLLSIVIARYLVSPLRVFENAGLRLARGDLHVRVSPELGNRGDEIAEFASTFDQMAAKIEGLVRAHQRLLRDVSHELRTPLARVLAATSLARKAASESAAPEFDRIELEVSRLDGMISRLLTYARLDADEARVNPGTVQLDELVSEIIEDSRIEADADGRQIVFSSAVPCVVTGDATLLRSCIENVLRNAMRFTPHGQRVDIELKKGEASVSLSIRDYGPGVAEVDLPHIFKPFYQTDPARTPQSGGYGIGLAIAHKAVELHAGHIDAENADGGGLRVQIELPVDHRPPPPVVLD